jgi:DNA-binding MarR family transcriptional regulator
MSTRPTNHSSEKRQCELDRALELLHFGFRAVIANPDRVLASRGLSRVHHRILFFVRRNPGCSVTQLLRILNISKQALNAPLRTLIQKKLVSNVASSEDRRVKQLRLTAKGEQLERTLSGDQRDRFAATFRRVGPAKEAAWRETMLRLADEQTR